MDKLSCPPLLSGGSPERGHVPRSVHVASRGWGRAGRQVAVGGHRGSFGHRVVACPKINEDREGRGQGGEADALKLKAANGSTPSVRSLFCAWHLLLPHILCGSWQSLTPSERAEDAGNSHPVVCPRLGKADGSWRAAVVVWCFPTPRPAHVSRCFCTP